MDYTQQAGEQQAQQLQAHTFIGFDQCNHHHHHHRQKLP